MYPRWASSSLALTNSAYLEVVTPNPNIINSLSSFTLEAWFNLSSNTKGYIFDKSTYSQELQIQFSLSISKTNINFYGSSGGSVAIPQLNIGINEWHHIAVAYDAVSQLVEIYLDWQLLNSSIITIENNLNTPVWIGASRDNTNNPSSFFEGHIGKIMIWDVCRSAGEIMTDAINTGIEYYQITNLSSTIPNTNPSYDVVRISPVVGFDFTSPPSPDISGLGNSFIYLQNGKYSTEPAYTFSVPATSFNGNSNYVTAGNLPIYHLNQDTSFTIDGWFMTNKTGTVQTIISLGNGTQEYEVSLREDNLLYVTRGTDTISSVGTLAINTYYHFAVSYSYLPSNPSKSILCLYINGNLRTVTFANSPIITQNAELLIGAANNSSGHTHNYFSGCIQSINFWNEAHDEAQVRQWMYNQIVTGDDVIGAFDLSIQSPYDTSDLTNLISYATFTERSFQVSSGGLPFGTPMPINATYLNKKQIEISNEQPAQLNIALQPKVFSEEHKQAIWEGVKNWIGPQIGTGAFKQKFEDAFEQAKQIMDNDPRLKKVISRIDKDGMTTLIYHGRHRDQIILSKATGVLNDCTLWWMGFVTQITIGFFEAIGLFPSIEGVAEKVYTKIVSNKTARAALITLSEEVITVSSAIDFIGVLVSEKIIWGIIKILLTMLGWWAITKLLATIIGIVTGLEAAALLAGFIIWAAQLIIITTEYQGSCGSSTPNPPSKL